VEEKRKHIYEGMYIIRPTLSDDAREKALKKITGFIDSLGGKVEKVIDWGRKKLAYEIKGSREGLYYILYFSLPTQTIDELIRENHLHEDLLRYMHIEIESMPQGDEIKFKQIIQMER
jgi:small subunit ribosomal protein S6